MHADIFNPALPQASRQKIGWMNLAGASMGLALSNLLNNVQQPLLILCENSLSTNLLLEELKFFAQEKQIIHFPDWETLPYDHFSPHQDIISERIAALSSMPMMQSGALLTTVQTIMHRLSPCEFIDQHSFVLKVGDHLNLDILRTRLTHAGYRNVSQVREHGEFALRGSIVDLFPMGSSTPFRIDCFDNEVDSIRLFSPETQRTVEKIASINLLPAKEYPLTEEAVELFRQNWRNKFLGNPLKSPLYQDVSEGIFSPGVEYYLPLFFNNSASLFDYLPKNCLIVMIGDWQTKAKEFWQEIEKRFEQGRYDTHRPLLSPHEIFITPKILIENLMHYATIQILKEDQPKDKSFAKIYPTQDHIYVFDTEAVPQLEINYKAAEPLASLKSYIAQVKARILFCAETMGRREVILQLFRNIDLHPHYYQSWSEFLSSQEPFGIVVTPIEEGFVLKEPKLVLLTETHLYGKRVMQRRLRKKSQINPDLIVRDLTELQINDPIVHIDHGIGRYRGLKTLAIGEQQVEFLCLEYQNEDKLYVPVSSLHLINRYTGADPEHTPIDKLGTDRWQKAKRKAAEKVRDTAAALLDLYARRAARPGNAYKIPEDPYAAFAAAFPFEETPDQLQAIEKVIEDLTSTKPMDRVICGDVGFGKTEVAMRAAFIAVENNKQVLVLVPTTLLAQQHYQNFQDRFADWPITVEMLSRFKTAKQQKQILSRLEEGKLDIVIGTHKLLQKDIKLKDLGLVIIDEEHRFGVKQKEKLKSLRTHVDILTLTATPIPRTLNMTLSGIRDLSIIATPPARRLSVKTFVHPYQNKLIQEAIQREIMRGGQVYFLHNEVSTIEKKANELEKLNPDARIAIAHGQMHERDLEQVMSEFYHRHFNVLVCSTIIESGIDIPTANTIIINRADKFGIAQLHQLRGRVGRSHHQAYAYLLTPTDFKITRDAVKRLDAVAAFDQLGIGFTLATHDLEIRGAGELLGEEQSGEMHEVGFSLYMDLLSRAVEALKAGVEPDLEKALTHPGTEIDLHITALIPERYIDDIQLRLQFYKHIASAENTAKLDEIQVEMIDRFGLLPDPLKQLFLLSELKIKANRLGIVKIEANEKGGRFEFCQQPLVKPETIVRLIQDPSGRFKLDGPTKLRFKLDPHELKDRPHLVQNVLNLLE